MQTKKTIKTQQKQIYDDILNPNPIVTSIMKAFEGLIYIVSSDYNIIYNNTEEFSLQHLNFKKEKCYTILHNRKKPCPFCVMDQVQQNQTVRFEIKNPGDNRWYHSINAPVHHSDGSLSMLAMITDVNNSKLAERFLENREMQFQTKNVFLRPDILERSKFGSIVGKTRAMQKIYKEILNAAATDAGIIIYGEPGTGKELVARVIHDMSKRRKNRFVPVHCGAIPEQLFESEFFGYAKGAFSGADTNRQGYLDFAEKGTLFLDEIGEISPHMQVKLLRSIEGGGHTPVGSNQVKSSDFRIIAATNRDLKQLVDKGIMRKDFFYRIHIIPIRLPPLRDRREDIPLLSDYFLEQYFDGDGSLLPVSEKFYDTLMEYDWPGNIRELQNAIIRYCATRSLSFIKTRISELNKLKEKKSFSIKNSENVHKTLKDHISDLEKKIIKETLEKKHWNISKTAALLNIDRKTLASRIKLYGLK